MTLIRATDVHESKSLALCRHCQTEKQDNEDTKSFTYSTGQKVLQPEVKHVIDIDVHEPQKAIY